MRLILEMYITDGFTFDCNTTLPFEAPSIEDAICELESLVLNHSDGSNEILFYGWELKPDTFTFYENGKKQFSAPNIYTVDEWFEQFCPKPKQ